MRKGALVVVVLLLIATVASDRSLRRARPSRDAAAVPGKASSMRVSETYGRIPLHFEANRGQTDDRVKFLACGRGYTLFLTPNEVVLALSQAESREGKDRRSLRRSHEPRRQVTRAALRMTFPGAKQAPHVEGREELPGKANYFIGNDPTKWRASVPTYARVHYRDLYPGIDLVYYGNQRQLEYDFVVRPGADPSRIALGFQGADNVEVDAQGDLVLHTAIGALRKRRPIIYQEIDGVRREISGGYVLKGDRLAVIQVSAYDTSRPLVIDPALFYSTYLGGSDSEDALAVAVDGAGNAYVTGSTASSDFPTTAGTFDTTFNGGDQDVFVTKLSPTGSGLVYSTYLGGSTFELGTSTAVDATGSAYVSGVTESTDFPTTLGAFDTTPNGGRDAFVTRIDPTGSGLVYSTYLGGGADDVGNHIALDAAGNAYVTGSTNSTDFPTTAGAFDTTFSSSLFDAYVTKLNPTGSGLVYSTYLSGTVSTTIPPDAVTVGSAIVVDGFGNAYLAGHTTTADFPTTAGAFDTSSNGRVDAFVTKLNTTGSALVYSTYLGGSASDFSADIALDALENAYVTGITDSADFPTTAGAVQPTSGGNSEAFVTKVDLTGSGLVYSTYIGGAADDQGTAIAVDSVGNAYVAGTTASVDFPTANAFQPAFGGDFDVFVAKLSATGAEFVYSSYLGGTGEDSPSEQIALDALPVPNIYVAGTTRSANFPTTAGAFDTTLGGFRDNFVVAITEAAVQPGPFSARITGGGTIDVVGGIGTFSFIIQRATTGELSGRLQYINHASGAQVQSETYTSLVIVGNTATFEGTCTVDGAPCTFTVNVTDNGEPGATDTFTISVSGGPTEGGVLRSGNILIVEQ